jgi:hypothetical protein
LYGRPKPRHFSQRHMVVSPHCGHGNFTAPSRGSIIRPHQLQLGIRTVRTSVNISDGKRSRLADYMPSHKAFRGIWNMYRLTLILQGQPIELSAIIRKLKDRLSSMQPLSLQTVISGMVWVICGLIVVATKVSVFARSASIYWEYVGGLMILVGVVRLLWGLVRGSKNTKPGFWSRVI